MSAPRHVLGPRHEMASEPADGMPQAAVREFTSNARSAHIAVIGEALVDIVADGGAHVGGSPLNVAVGLARLGLPVELHSRIGDDAHGLRILQHLERSGVRTAEDFVRDGRTSTALATLDAHGRAGYAFDLDWDLRRADIEAATVVHLGSIGAVLEPGGTVAREALLSADPGVLRSYDPNVRAGVMGEPRRTRAMIRELAAACHVVKLSDEDAAWLGAESGETTEQVLEGLAASGARLVVMTRGADGCVALVDGQRHERPALPAQVVDTIGAGDAFMSGLLYGLVRADANLSLAHGGPIATATVEQVLDAALASSAIVVSRAGADPPSLHDLSSRTR